MVAVVGETVPEEEVEAKGLIGAGGRPLEGGGRRAGPLYPIHGATLSSLLCSVNNRYIGTSLSAVASLLASVEGNPLVR